MTATYVVTRLHNHLLGWTPAGFAAALRAPLAALGCDILLRDFDDLARGGLHGCDDPETARRIAATVERVLREAT